MAQPSVASYFNTRKRAAVDEIKISRARKLLHRENAAGDESLAAAAVAVSADNESSKAKAKALLLDADVLAAKIEQVKESRGRLKKAVRHVRTQKVAMDQPRIQDLLANMPPRDKAKTMLTTDHEKDQQSLGKESPPVHRTPPATPTKINAMDKLKPTGKELTIKEIRQKLTRSSRLAEVKASMARFKEMDLKLQEMVKAGPTQSESPGLKSFNSIELEVNLSPVKSQTPEKKYLSPKKEPTAKRNLLSLLSPGKNVSVTSKVEQRLLSMDKMSLTMPFKYRMLAELFRSIDTVCQIMHNRDETITFKKLKPAVEELTKRNLTEKHLAQIKCLMPDAFDFRQEKLRPFGSKVEVWELVITPRVASEPITSEALLERRRALFQVLLDRVKHYHQEFLATLEPPMVIDADKVRRWHPEFDYERVPDVDGAELPQPPCEERLIKGKDVLERARLMFSCNTRMEAALERLQRAVPNGAPPPPTAAVAVADAAPDSLLKGIPQSLLERVRQKQAARALAAMTRTDARDREVQMYAHLPEVARLTRNIFVAEKRSVLQVDVVLEKLGRSSHAFMPKEEIEACLRLLEKEVPTWLMFHNIRNQDYIKIAKDADLSMVQGKLEKILKLKQAA